MSCVSKNKDVFSCSTCSFFCLLQGLSIKSTFFESGFFNCNMDQVLVSGFSRFELFISVKFKSRIDV